MDRADVLIQRTLLDILSKTESARNAVPAGAGAPSRCPSEFLRCPREHLLAGCVRGPLGLFQPIQRGRDAPREVGRGRPAAVEVATKPCGLEARFLGHTLLTQAKVGDPNLENMTPCHCPNDT